MTAHVFTYSHEEAQRIYDMGLCPALDAGFNAGAALADLQHYNQAKREEETRNAVLKVEDGSIEDAFIKAILHEDYAYCRARDFGTMVYHRCPGSPSGVYSAGCGIVSNDFARAALAKYGKTAVLSPTEGQHTSGANLYR